MKANTPKGVCIRGTPSERLIAVLTPQNTRMKFKELRRRTKLTSAELSAAITAVRKVRSDLCFGKFDHCYWFANRPTWYSNQTDLSGIMPLKGAFGFVTDTHLCSIAERLDVMEEAYSTFAALGITTVFHTGDLSDGWNEYRHHINFVKCHGDQAQAKYVIQHYPKRKGITTYVIGGNHDDSYAASKIDRLSLVTHGFHYQGEDIKGRDDIVYLGQYSHYIIMPQEVRLHMLHPRGGNAYALSYKQQKRFEAMPRNERPDIQLSGHFHTYCHVCPDGVHMVAGAGVQDETEFFKRLGFMRSIGFQVCEYEIEKGLLKSFSPTCYSRE